MKKCPRCLKYEDESIRFCKHCGTELFFENRFPKRSGRVINDIKRRVRKLKKAERTIRFKEKPNAKETLIWDSFFDLSNAPVLPDTPAGKAKYTLAELSSMNREEYKDIVAEFFANVYYLYYMENGILSANLYSPSLLSQLDLPPDAEENDIKKRFRELAKKYHPDTDGDPAKFIELMKVYEELTGTE